MKRPSLIIREFKSNLTSHPINSYDQKNRKQVLARMWRNWNPYARLVKILSGIALVENSTAVLQKIKNKITMWSSNFISEYIHKSTACKVSKRYFYTHVHSSISTVVKIWKQHKHPLTGNQNVVCMYIYIYIHTTECYSSIKRKLCNMDVHWWHHAKWNKPVTKRNVLHHSTYMRYLK